MSRYCLMVLLLLSSFLTFDVVQARPGGGHSSHSSSSHSSSHSSSSSYHSSSSSSHSSGGSGSSMSGEEFLALLVIIVIIVLLIYFFNRNAPRNYVAAPTSQFRAQQQLSIAEQIAVLKRSDAIFPRYCLSILPIPYSASSIACRPSRSLPTLVRFKQRVATAFSKDQSKNR